MNLDWNSKRFGMIFEKSLILYSIRTSVKKFIVHCCEMRSKELKYLEQPESSMEGGRLSLQCFKEANWESRQWIVARMVRN